ncbi:MAG: type IX secretion system protein PorQ [Bacteroidales bacterium]|nr:type IX secretion system protein PorQ [Bacteroidales bacterium]
MTRKVLITTTLLATMTVAKMYGDDSHYSFLDLSASSHIHSLGGVNISTVEDNIMTVDQNPGLLGSEMSNQLGLSYMHYLNNINFGEVVFCHSIGINAAWQASIRYLNYGKIDSYDENGNALGRISPSDFVFSGGYTREFSETIRGGFLLKTIYSSYDEYWAMALGVDLGVNYYDIDRDLSLSAVISNLGGQVKRFDREYNRLPVDVRLGWTQSFAQFPVRFSVTAFNLTKWHLPYIKPGDGSVNSQSRVIDNFGSNLMRHLVFGADIIPSDKFHFAIGYNYKTATDMASDNRNFISGFAVGAGLKIKGFNVDVSYSHPLSGASVLMLNLTLDFKALIK